MGHLPINLETEHILLKKLKYIFITLLLMVTASEVMTFVYSAIAEHKAERLTELLATLRPGYTTMDSAKALFQAHGLNVGMLSNACNTSNGPCYDLVLRAANFPSIIPLHLGRLAGITPIPLPPVKPASFMVNMYFINGVLDSINSVYRVGTTDVKYSRGAGNYQARTSKWKYSNQGKVTSISVSSSGTVFDVSFPHFALNYMYSVKSPDARELWPSAPLPTTEPKDISIP